MAGTSHGIQVVERERIEVSQRDSGPGGDRLTDPATGSGSAMSAGALGVMGLLTLLVGAWGGIVPFVGPLFGFDGDGSVAWYWSLPHVVLWLAPGGAACVAAGVTLGVLPRVGGGRGRVGAFGAGALAVLGGAWFVVGPEAWPVLVRSAGVFAPGGPLRALAHEVGYSFGPGLLLVMLGALTMAVAGRSPHLARVGRPKREPAPKKAPATSSPATA